MKQSTLTCALLLGLSFVAVAHAQSAPSTERACLDQVIHDAEQAPASDEAAELQFQRQILSCISPAASGELIGCAAAIRRDYTALAIALRREELPAALYLQRIRDRTRKLTRCLHDSAWTEQLALGDADGDQVGDALDACPDTTRLGATDDTGCPIHDAMQSEGPDPELVRRMFQTPVLVPNRACQDAKAPTLPLVLSADSIDYPSGARPRLRVVLGAIPNLTPMCPVAYELEIEELVPLTLIDPVNPPRRPQRLRLVVSARSSRPSADPSVLVFEREHPRLTFFFHWGARFRVRVIDGAGQRSLWSDKVRIGQL